MENYIIPNKVYVLNKSEVLLAVFDKDDEEPIINPQIQKTQNAETVFTFSIDPNNSKWIQINNPENLYVVDGKVFSTNFEGCFTEILNENNENLIQVTAYERQKLLSRKFVKAWNSETGFETIDDFMVVILSNGDLPLKNNGTIVNSTHLKGTSGYVLDGLLYGTGWTTGVCDVTGTFDFETEQVDIYENILKVQEIWGGILVFDSINKIVHHRDETTWLPYNGYEVKYQKNMQSLEKLYNNKIITKLCPLGEGGLNIKTVNNNSIWLTDFTYTDTVLEGIENNPDIYDAEQLKRWGQRKLQDLCKPRTELTVKAALLYQVEGYELERVDLNDIVDVINFANIDRDVIQLRVVGFTYKIWDYSDAILELSDITLDSTDIFKKNVQAANQINAGTLDTTQVVSFFRAGQTVEKSLRNLDNAVAEIIIYEDSIVSTVKNGGLNLLNDTTNTEWKDISVTAIEGRSASMANETDIADLDLAVGDKITYSLYIKTTSGKKLRARISYYDSSSTPITPSAYAEGEYIVQNAIGYSYATGTIPEDCKYISLWIDADLTSSTVTATTTEQIKSEKLEKGIIPTTWTPAISDYSTSTEVAQTAASITSTAIKNIEIGGRNLILNSENAILQTGAAITQDTLSLELVISPAFIPKDYAGKDMVLSWYGEASNIEPSSYEKNRYGAEFSLKLNDGTTWVYQGAWRYGLFDDWTGRYYNVIHIPENWNGEIGERNLYIQGFESGTDIKIYKPKLELGNKVTDWSRAPEDIDETFANLEEDTSNLIIDTVNKAVDHLNSTAGSRREYAYINVGQSYMNVADGTTVTLSFDLEMQVNSANPYLLVYNTNNSGPRQFNAQTLTFYSYSVGSTIKQRCSVTSTISVRNEPTKTDNYLEFYSSYDSSNWFKISNIKLELGNKATPWSPSLKQLSTVFSQTATDITIGAQENSSGTSCGITIKLKNPNGTDLATGTANITLSGLVKFTDLSGVNSTTIDGSNITTGTIKSSNYVSGTSGTSINLSTGVIDTKGFKVNANGEITSTAGTIGGFSLSATSFTKSISGIYNYNNFDKTLVAMKIMGYITLDTNMFNILDADGSGSIAALDYVKITNIINGTSTNTKTCSGSFEINSNNPKYCAVVKDSSGNIVCALGIGGIDANFISASQCVIGVPGNSYNDSTYVSIDGSRGNLYASGTISQGSLQEIKKNFEKLENALSIISSTDIYKFNYKTETDESKKHIGFVIGDNFKYSQEITNAMNNGVDMYSFIAVCCKAIQELAEEIKLLKERN